MSEIKPLQRKFFPEEFRVTTWEAIAPYADDLLNRKINSVEEFQRFLEDQNELDIILKDEYNWREIAVTRNTEDASAKDCMKDYEENIDPPLAIFKDKLDNKIAASAFASDYGQPGFPVLLQRLQNRIKIFRPENIPLSTKIAAGIATFRGIAGNWKVTLDGKEQTFNQAEDRLSWNERAKREEAWKAKAIRLKEGKDELDKAFDAMFDLRQQQAKNAGFENYRDYKFADLNRCYTPKDCADFHASVKEHVVPFVKEMQIARRNQMGVETLYPWDLAVDPLNRPPVVAFENEADFIRKSERMFKNIDPVFGDIFRLIRDKKRLDLMSRPKKGPGAYMQPLMLDNIPYIFQNSTGKAEDVGVIAHEGGHAIHEVLMAPTGLRAYRDYPMEIAELGSMTMELLSLDQWPVFYKNKEELLRVRREHLEDIITILPWLSLVDEFQNKLYTAENPSIEQRHALWADLCDEYKTGEVETTGFAHPTRNSWHIQYHIFAVPFYYIDYGVAQCGALEVWRNYKQDPVKTMQQYKEALALGGTKSIKEVYQNSGASFDFSNDKIKELMAFVGTEITDLREREMAEYRKNNSGLALAASPSA